LECTGICERYDHKLDDKNCISMKSATDCIPGDDDDDMIMMIIMNGGGGDDDDDYNDVFAACD
jgi:hypothetical protein